MSKSVAKITALTLGLAFFAQMSVAANLAAPFDVENTSVLPKGINNPRVRSLWLDMSEKYNGAGQMEAQSLKLNKPLTWKQVVEAQDASMRPFAQGSINSLCAPGTQCNQETDGPGSTTGNLSVNVNVVVPTWVRGLTDSTVMIVALPVYKIDVKADTGFNPNASYAQWSASMAGDPLQQDQINNKFKDPINDKATKLGYDRLESSSTSAIGDMKLGGKTEFFRDGIDSMAWKGFVTLPTGTRPNADKLVDTATGDGGYALSSMLIWDHALTDYFKSNVYGGLNYQFSDRLERRIPTSNEDTLSADKELVDRKRGNQYMLGTSMLVGKSTRGVSGSLGYLYQYMDATTFSGSQYAKERYSYLENQFPSQTMHSALAVVNYSTIDYYKDKTFAIPLTATFSYSRVLSGVNVAAGDLISSELLLFF